MKVARNRATNLLANNQKAVGPPKIPKFHHLGFLFFVNFHLFFYFVAFYFTYLYLLKNSKIFCGVFLYQLQIYQPIIHFF